MRGLSKERPSFDYFVDNILKGAGVSNPNAQERTLILESRLKRENRTLQFKILKSASTKDDGREIKLDNEDIFMATHIRLSLQKMKMVGDYEIPVSPDLTFVDTAYFTGVVDSVKEADALQAIYDGGKLSLENKSVKRLTEMDTALLMVVPLSKISGYPCQNIDLESKGYRALVNPFVLSGKAENDIFLRLGYMLGEVMEGKFNDKGEDVGTYNVVRLKLHGVVGVNAAEKYSTWLATNTPR